MTICTAFFTCGRREYFEQTLASYSEKVSGPVTRVVIFDDSGDADYRAWLETLTMPTIHGPRPVSVMDWGPNRGFSNAVHRSWKWISRHVVEPYIAHVEEDFLYDIPIDLTHLIDVLEGDDDLDEVALLRAAYFPRELRVGGIYEEHPEAYEHLVSPGGHRYIKHDLVFTTNPCVYRRELCGVGWPNRKASENYFTKVRAAEGRKFAYMGSGETCLTHIGAVRGDKGHGY